MSKRDANFCPNCGTPFEVRDHSGHLRPVCPNCGYVMYFDPKVAVVIFIQQDNQVLLIKRGNDPRKGYWAMPAGFVEAEEDPREAAQRETLEETCLNVRVERLLDVFFTAGDGGMADIVIGYEAHILDGTPIAADDAEDVGWFTKEELPELAFMPSQRLAERWVAGEFEEREVESYELKEKNSSPGA